MDLSVNHLDIEGKMWNWLVSPDISEQDRKNKNRSQYRTDFVKNHLQKSIRDLFHIMPRSRKLKKEAIYDTFNALTLVDILQNLLLNVEQKSERRTEKYDFRTVELARMFYHVSTNYLMNSPIWKDEENVKNDVNLVASHFRILAKSVLDKDSHGTIKEKDERKITSELDNLKSEPQSEYQKLEQKLKILYEEKKPFRQRLTELDKLKREAETLKKTHELEKLEKELEKVRVELKKINEKIDQVTKKRNDALEKINTKENEVKELLSHKYDHLSTFFCPYDKLDSFKNILNNPHLPKDHPASPLDLMFKPYYAYRYT